MWRDKKRRKNRERESSHAKGNYYMFISDFMQYLITTLYGICKQPSLSFIHLFGRNGETERTGREGGQYQVWAPIQKVNTCSNIISSVVSKMYDQLIWLLIFCTLISPISYLSLRQRRGGGGGEERRGGGGGEGGGRRGEGRRGEEVGGQYEVWTLM